MFNHQKPSNTRDDELIEVFEGLTRRRVGRILMYLFLSIGAVFFVLFPSELFLEQSSYILRMVWTVLFLLASISCLVGAITDRWFLEYSGIPLLSASLSVFTIALFAAAFTDETGLLVIYASVFGALSSELFARWRDVRTLIRVSIAVSRQEEE